MEGREVGTGSLSAALFEELSQHRQDVGRYLAIFMPLEFGSSLADILLGMKSPLDPTGLGSRAGFANGPFGTLVLLASIYGQLVLFRRMLHGGEASRPTFIEYMGFLGLGILSFTGVSAATLLFFVPGLFVASRWLMCPAFYAEGEIGVFGSLGASWQAARGHTRAIMLALLVVVLLYLVGAGIMAPLAKGFATLGPTMRAFGAAMADAVTGELWSVMLIGASVAAYRAIVQPQRHLAEIFE